MLSRAKDVIVARTYLLIIRTLNRGGHGPYAQLDTLFVVGLGLHVLGEIALGLEGKVAVAARVGPEVAVRPDVLLQHRGLLAPDAAALANVPTPTAPPHVGVVVVVVGLVAALDLAGRVIASRPGGRGGR